MVRRDGRGGGKEEGEGGGRDEDISKAEGEVNDPQAR